MMLTAKEEKYLTMGLKMVQDGVKERDGFRLETVGIFRCSKCLLLRNVATDRAVIRFTV